MNAPELEYRRIKISAGKGREAIKHLAASHPFVQQVNIVFPSSLSLSLSSSSAPAAFADGGRGTLEDALLALSLPRCYVRRGRVGLYDVLQNASAFVGIRTQGQGVGEDGKERGGGGAGGGGGGEGGKRYMNSDLILITTGSKGEDDAWCVDTRGVLTLSVCKTTYEELGIVGEKLPFKGYGEDRWAIRLSLHKHSDTPGNIIRRDVAIKNWDARRESRGLGKWEVLWSSTVPEQDTVHPPSFGTWGDDTTSQRPFVRRSTDVHIPVLSYIAPRPDVNNQKGADAPMLSVGEAQELEDAVEDWNVQMKELVEWVGLACLGSHRLKANDSVDPYVGLYSPPSPSQIGDVTYMSWRGLGLYPPWFVQKIINVAISGTFDFPDPLKHDSHSHRPPTVSSGVPFVAITIHSRTWSPIAYISPTVLNTPIVGIATLVLDHAPTNQKGKGKSKGKGAGGSGGGSGSAGGAVRVPREDGEDSLSLIFTGSGSGSDGDSGGGVETRKGKDGTWCLVESVGQFDSRFG